MIEIHEKGMLANLIDWIAAKTFFRFLYYPNCYRLIEARPPPYQETRDALVILKKAVVSALRQFVKTGTLALVKAIRAAIIVGTMCAASAVGLTRPRIEPTALQLSTNDASNREQALLVAAASKAREAEAAGTRQLKRKATNQISEIPRYKRGFVWEKPSSSSRLSPSALATETARPLASPPSHLVHDPSIQSTLHAMRDFIRVETPFNVDRFEALLYDHPNQPFVKSVMDSLRYGFWPFDEGNWKDDRDDVVLNYSSEEVDFKAIRDFRDDEIRARHWSDPLPSNTFKLLPGMKISPIFVVWQHGKPRVVTDHTASGLNDCIPRPEAKVHYDDMRTFGQVIFNAKHAHPHETLVTWKSDVSSAFLNLPAHPIYQLRQVVDVDGTLRIIHRLVFGNRASPRCWCSVAGLMCWLGIKKFDVKDLHDFMDDFFSWAIATDLVFYKGVSRPRPQARLLMLWDEIGCPWKDKKQEFGTELKIIGFYVDINRGTLTLSDNSISDILDVIRAFLATPGRRPSLCEWLRVGGHLNWVFNVLPLGRPALGEFYKKISGKSLMNAGVALNADVVRNFEWLIDVIPKAIGVHFVAATHWDDHEANLVLWTDASLRLGLGFVYATRGFVYAISPSSTKEKVDIFFLELLAILSAIHHIALFRHPPKKVLLWTDSLDSVAAYSSLRASESMHNSVLLALAGVLLETGMDLRIRHIAGKVNTKADLLSRLMIDEYYR